MTTSHLFPACLMLHLMALAVFTGTTLVDYLAHLSLCRSFGQNENTKPLLNLMAKLPRIGGIGAAILILSGFSMMALTHGVFGEQLWFKIKFGLVILIILNSTVIIRRQSGKLRRLTTNGSIVDVELNQIKNRLSRFYLLQLLLFILIIFLSAFKFN